MNLISNILTLSFTIMTNIAVANCTFVVTFTNFALDVDDVIVLIVK